MGARTRAGLVLFLSAAAPSPSARTQAPTEGPCCAATARGWMLFADESRDVPDFWNAERVEVREISICDHAIQLTFTVNERGSPHLAALVFPVPTRGIVETRLGFPFGTPAYAMELAHLERRYASLDVALRSISGGSLVRGTRLPFDGPASSDRPVLLAPSRLLALRWNGTELPLRGYLDVYFTLVS